MTKKTLRTALVFGLPWAVILIVYFFITKGFLPELAILILVLGLLIGFIFAWALQFMTKGLLKKITVKISDNERIIREGGANHFKGMEGVGGKLVLTNKRLIFKSHKLNVQNHQDNFELEKIERLRTNKTLGFIANGLIVELANQERHRFVVDAPQDWIEIILKQKQDLLN